MKDSLLFRLAAPEDRRLVEAFYRQDGHSPAVSATDLILLALIEADIVGLLRLCPEENVLVLRRMRVRADVRGHGIGTALLHRASEHLASRDCYCLPFSHLTDFYAQIGFRTVFDDALPRFLQERAVRYRAKGESIAPMFRGAE